MQAANLHLIEQPYIRLNLGCGRDLRNGWVNVDVYGEADIRHDLNVRPWPWADDSACEVIMHNVMEHLPDTCAVMRELYRVCAKDAVVRIAVPHPLHDDFVSDPTHVSRITGRTMQAFSKKFCDMVKDDANNPLAYLNDVDFEVTNHTYVMEPVWMRRKETGELNEEQLLDAIRTFNNVVKQIEITLRVVK